MNLITKNNRKKRIRFKIIDQGCLFLDLIKIFMYK